MTTPETFYNNSIASLDWFQRPFSLSEGEHPVNKQWFRNARFSLYDNLITRHSGTAIKYIYKGSVYSLSFENLNCLIQSLDQQIRNHDAGFDFDTKVAIYCSTGITSSLAALWCIFRGFKYLPLLTDITSSRFDYYINDFRPDVFITDSLNVTSLLNNYSVPHSAQPHYPVFILGDEFFSICNESFPLCSSSSENTSTNSSVITLYPHSCQYPDETPRPSFVSDTSHEIFAIYTSGTTGLPKSIHHSTIQFSVYSLLTSEYFFFFDPSFDSICCGLGFGWINGQTYALIGPLLLGKSISFLSSVDVAKSFKALSLELNLLSPAVYYTSVAVVRQLVFYAQAIKAEPINVPSIKNIGCAGEMLSPSISRAFSQLFGFHDFIPVNTYFQSETGGVLTATRDIDFSGSARSLAHGSCGVIPPWLSFSLSSVDDQALIPESPTSLSSGVLHVSSAWPGLFARATRGSSDVTRSYFDEYGFYRLNDYGYYRTLDDDHKVICVEGRSDDVINSNGVRIAPGELEQIANSFDLILESCCIGLPDLNRGSSIALILSFNSLPTRRETLHLFGLIQVQIKSQLGSFYVPQFVFSTLCLPKTPSGKIVRQSVRTTLIDSLSVDSVTNGDTIAF